MLLPVRERFFPYIDHTIVIVWFPQIPFLCGHCVPYKWKNAIFENILQDVLQALASHCHLSCKLSCQILARFLQKMNWHCVRLARKVSTFQDICMLRFRNRGVQRTFHSIKQHLFINSTSPYSLAVKKPFTDIFIQNVFKQHVNRQKSVFNHPSFVNLKSIYWRQLDRNGGSLPKLWRTQKSVQSVEEIISLEVWF